MYNSFSHTLDVYIDAKDPHENPEFVGYGNPFSDVLIIGQEVTYPVGSVEWERFYKNNCQQWKETLDFGLVAHELNERPGASIDDYAFPDFFNPRNPFYPMEFSRKKSATWYNYQKIMDAVFPHQDGILNMFDYCFLTELSNISSRHNPNTKDVELSIAHRFDLMKESVDFWGHFRAIILACGPYAKVILDKQRFPNLEKELFGSEGKTYHARQLSIVSNAEINSIQNFILDKIR